MYFKYKYIQTLTHKHKHTHIQTHTHKIKMREYAKMITQTLTNKSVRKPISIKYICRICFIRRYIHSNLFLFGIQTIFTTYFNTQFYSFSWILLHFIFICIFFFFSFLIRSFSSGVYRVLVPRRFSFTFLSLIFCFYCYYYWLKPMQTKYLRIIIYSYFM